LLSESNTDQENAASILVFMQQDFSENSERTLPTYDGQQQGVKNTCVGTDELELLMLEDQHNIDSLSSHMSHSSY
jgi:hypothetical protein